MPFPDFSRNRYFTGRLLDESDLTDEQEYHLGKHRLLNRTLHGWGVVSGQDVEPGDGDSEILVSPGFALDGWGREIVVSTTLRVAIPPCPDDPDGDAERPGDCWFTIRIEYEESDRDPMPSPTEVETPVFGTIVEGHSVRAEPGLPASRSDPGAALPSDPSVVLATLRRSSHRPHLHVDTRTHRREIPSSAALLEMIQRLERRIARLLDEGSPTDPSP